MRNMHRVSFTLDTQWKTVNCAVSVFIPIER
jgi:hypothetical protein